MSSTTSETVQPNDLARSLLLKISEEVSKSRKRHYLMGVLATDDSGSHEYANWTRKKCEEVGVHFHLLRVSPENITTYIYAINANPSVHGIIVYYPVFGDNRDCKIKQLVSHEKDVEGLSHQVLSRPFEPAYFPTPCHQTRSVIPCTPLSITWILQWMNVYDCTLPQGEQLRNREICIINRSNVVGLPLAQLLACEGARVYSVDINNVQLFHRGHQPQESTKLSGKDLLDWTLQDALPRSQVVISAVPDRAFKVDTRLLMDGVICVNVSSEKNFRPDVVEIASKFVPRVGSVTIAALLHNLVVCSSWR